MLRANGAEQLMSSPSAQSFKHSAFEKTFRAHERFIWGRLRPSEIVQGAVRYLAQSLLETFSVRRSPAKIVQVAIVNGGHKLSPDLRATNQEIQHEDCGYRR
jgi:hypothetical protein